MKKFLTLILTCLLLSNALNAADLGDDSLFTQEDSGLMQAGIKPDAMLNFQDLFEQPAQQNHDYSARTVTLPEDTQFFMPAAAHHSESPLFTQQFDIPTSGDDASSATSLAQAMKFAPEESSSGAGSHQPFPNNSVTQNKTNMRQKDIDFEDRYLGEKTRKILAQCSTVNYGKKSFKSREELIDYVAHENNEPFTCLDCGKTTQIWSNFKNHQPDSCTRGSEYAAASQKLPPSTIDQSQPTAASRGHSNNKPQKPRKMMVSRPEFLGTQTKAALAQCVGLVYKGNKYDRTCDLLDHLSTTFNEPFKCPTCGKQWPKWDTQSLKLHGEFECQSIRRSRDLASAETTPESAGSGSIFNIPPATTDTQQKRARKLTVKSLEQLALAHELATHSEIDETQQNLVNKQLTVYPLIAPPTLHAAAAVSPKISPYNTRQQTHSAGSAADTAPLDTFSLSSLAHAAALQSQLASSGAGAQALSSKLKPLNNFEIRYLGEKTKKNYTECTDFYCDGKNLACKDKLIEYLAHKHKETFTCPQCQMLYKSWRPFYKHQPDSCLKPPKKISSQSDKKMHDEEYEKITQRAAIAIHEAALRSAQMNQFLVQFSAQFPAGAGSGPFLLQAPSQKPPSIAAGYGEQAFGQDTPSHFQHAGDALMSAAPLAGTKHPRDEASSSERLAKVARLNKDGDAASSATAAQSKEPKSPE